MRSIAAFAVIAALLMLAPAVFAQPGHHRRAGPAAGMTRSDYIKADEARAGNAAAKRFDRIDTDHKGVIDRATYIRYYQARAAKLAGRRFDRIDKNHDGALEPAEVEAWRAARQRRAPPAQPAAH